ncbi:MAG: RecX family transcriptional regulator [bacterium]|nr:RecX family transcriptional regulator [bacterium]
MGKITALEAQKKNPKRVNIFVDGEFAVGLDLETAVKGKLEVGKELSEEEIKHLKEASDRQKTLDKVFNFLSYRPRSQKEVRDYMVKKKVDEEEISDILNYLSGKKYLNDEEFARWWIEQRMTFRPTGWRLLKMELKQKGVGEEVVNGIMNPPAGEAGREAGIMEKTLAEKVAEKKLRAMGKLPPEKAREKLFAALARRGFEWDVIKRVVDEILKKK